MHRRPGRAVCGVALTATVLFGAAGCSSSSDPSALVASTSANLDTVLGSPNKASGTTVKIGFIADGKGNGLDTTSASEAADAAAKYANDYLGGLNGHPIELLRCDTGNTPSGATTCASKMVEEKTTAVLVGFSTQSNSIVRALKDSGIPYVTRDAIDPDVLLTPGAFVLANPAGGLAAGVLIAQEKGIKKTGIVYPDVPAAAGIGVLAKPLYENAGQEIDLVGVPLEAPDLTPDLQESIGRGTQQFLFAGNDDFVTKGVKALKQLGFEGPILLGAGSVSPSLAETVPGGTSGVYNLTFATTDPADPDVQTFNAVLRKYSDGTQADFQAQSGYSVTLGLLRAVEGTNASDAATVAAALSGMPKPVNLPLGGGIVFRCGTKPASYAPNVCGMQILQSTLDEVGVGHDFRLLDISTVKMA